MKNIKKITLIFSLIVFAGVASATSANSSEGVKENKVTDHLVNHYKLYGFVRNYFTYDSREGVDGTQDLFYYLPKDNKFNELGDDLNALPSFRYVSLTTRLGLDVSGYKVGKTAFGAKVEADFYLMSGPAAAFRMRQAYATLAWDNLPMGENNTAKVNMKIGQAWHPFSADLPPIISLTAGAPFHAFSRTPQVTMDATLGKNFIVSASALWQMQYSSIGPTGKNMTYLNYSCVPELYAGLTYQTKGFKAKAGVNFLSIKPRVTGANSDGVQVKVNDRLNTSSAFVFLQYSKNAFSVSAKSTYGSDGSHMSLLGGYGVTQKYDDGHWDYTALHSSSSWLTLSYGKKVKGILMLGYYKNLGSNTDLLNENSIVAADDFYFNTNGFQNLNSLYRIVPTVTYNLGKFQLGLEYEVTSAQYGDGKSYNTNGLSLQDLHWVTNHRVQAMVKFSF